MAFGFIENGAESKYSVGKEISRGAFGVVKAGKDHVTNDIVDKAYRKFFHTLNIIQFQVAIKIKKFDAKTGSSSTDLDPEIVAYKRLDGVPGIPKAMAYGSNFLAMERLGLSLAGIQRKNNYKPFPLRSILLIADQLIVRIESMHSRGISHRDIKLDNIIMGLGTSANVLHIIDFGLAIADDLSDCQQIYRKIDLKQAGLAIKSLYQGSIGVVTPAEIILYMEYCRNLKDEDRINYKYLGELFREKFQFYGFTGNVIFD